MKAYVFLANGFEETEAIAPIDVMRRAGIDVVTVSVTGEEMVTSSHNVSVRRTPCLIRWITLTLICWCCQAVCQAP